MTESVHDHTEQSKIVTAWNIEPTASEKRLEKLKQDLSELEARTTELQVSFTRLIDSERYVQTHIILQDLNTFLRIEDVYLGNNQTVIADALRMLNLCQIGGWHYLCALPRKKAIALSDYKPLRRYDDTQADLCRKFEVLRDFLSSPAMTDKIIDRVGRDVFFAIKSHFEAQIAGDALAPAKTLTAEQLASIDHEIRHCLHPFPEFEF